MARHFSEWLLAYCDYASFSEAPRKMHFFSGVAAIAGALRRKVWIDQAYFRWYPNHYIVFVAPPGVVSKSTTVAIAMNLLRSVPGINFGPDVITWPALVTAFASASEAFELAGEWHTQCALTLESSEFGNLVNPQDREMIDLLVTLWDSKTGAFKKITKGSGSDHVENPFINMIACTTPAWIAGNFPEYVIGGGFTSRCLFVYAEVKDKLVPYPVKSVPAGMKRQQELLIADLGHISTLVGPYQLTPEAIEWGTLWYTEHHKILVEDDKFAGYAARKQTHLHKLAIILAAATRDELIITAEDLALAAKMITDLEPDMAKVFARIGKTDQSVQADRFIQFVRVKGQIPYEVAYQYVHSHFPMMRDFEGIIAGAIKAGYITVKQEGPTIMLVAVKKDVENQTDSQRPKPISSPPGDSVLDSVTVQRQELAELAPLPKAE